MNSRSGFYLSIKLFLLFLTTQMPLPAWGADGPDSMVGRWVVDSYWINGKKEESLILQTKEGALWKLFDDGTGEIASYKQKWKYDKKSRALQ